MCLYKCGIMDHAFWYFLYKCHPIILDDATDLDVIISWVVVKYENIYEVRERLSTYRLPKI